MSETGIDNEQRCPHGAVLGIAELAALADAVSCLDGLKEYALATEAPALAELIHKCHTIIERAAGEHASALYPEGDDDDASTQGVLKMEASAP